MTSAGTRAPSGAVAAPAAGAGDARIAAAWAVLDTVADPELPALSLLDLGIVRDVVGHPDRIEVVLTPTYSGCPVTEVIAASVSAALRSVGLGPVAVSQRLAPAWTSDWISAAGRAKLLAYGIVPPCRADAATDADAAAEVVRIRPRGIDCPRCASPRTERLSAFGSTACKALHRCLDCREPFEYFKPL